MLWQTEGTCKIQLLWESRWHLNEEGGVGEQSQRYREIHSRLSECGVSGTRPPAVNASYSSNQCVDIGKVTKLSCRVGKVA